MSRGQTRGWLAPPTGTRTALQPFIFGGFGWSYFQVVGEDFNASAINDSDNVFQVPMPMTGTLSPSAAAGIFRRSNSRGDCVLLGAAAPATVLPNAMAIVPRK